MNRKYSSQVFVDKCNCSFRSESKFKTISEDTSNQLKLNHHQTNYPNQCKENMLNPNKLNSDESSCNVNSSLMGKNEVIKRKGIGYRSDETNDFNSHGEFCSVYPERVENQTVEYECLYQNPKYHDSTQRRTSLHGKTITIRVSRNETRYRKLQAKIYNFLERPKTWPSVIYHVFVFVSVFGCLVLSVLSTIPEFTESAGRILLYMELIILFWFFAEYCMRLWSAGCRSRYQTWRGRFHFAQRPFCIVDVIVIVASVVVLAVDGDGNMFAASALRGLRFFQILRMIRMDRRGGSFKLLASVVWAHRQELFTTVYIGFLCLIFSSFLIYLVERSENEKIRTYADALWWGVITLCTVGYGDTVPRTWMGKIIAAFCAMAGISFFALPAGILGSGFALKVQQHQRQKHLIRRRVPAATLIQCLWRCYAADPHSSSTATWKIHMRPLRKPAGLTNSYSMIERGGFSRFSRFSTLKRRSEKNVSGVLNTNTTIETNKKVVDEQFFETPRSAPAQQETSEGLEPFSNSGEEIILKQSEGVFASELHKLVIEKQENKNDYLVSQEKVSNIINSSLTKEYELTQPKQTQNQQLVYPRNCATLTNHASKTKGPSLELAQNSGIIMRQLTEKEKTAIRIVRKIRFLVARRKFREALRPYDVKDVIEQYSAGHLDMLARVKILQSRLDQILGQSCGKNEEIYDSHQCLASRIVKIEHKLDAVDLKMDHLVNLYKTDHLYKCQNGAGTKEFVKQLPLTNTSRLCISNAVIPLRSSQWSSKSFDKSSSSYMSQKDSLFQRFKTQSLDKENFGNKKTSTMTPTVDASVNTNTYQFDNYENYSKIHRKLTLPKSFGFGLNKLTEASKDQMETEKFIFPLDHRQICLRTVHENYSTFFTPPIVTDVTTSVISTITTTATSLNTAIPIGLPIMSMSSKDKISKIESQTKSISAHVNENLKIDQTRDLDLMDSITHISTSKQQKENISSKSKHQTTSTEDRKTFDYI